MDHLRSLGGPTTSWSCDPEVLACLNGDEPAETDARSGDTGRDENLDVNNESGIFDECDASGGNGSGKVSLERLLCEMVDLARLTQIPRLRYTSHLASSTDPLSRDASPGDPDWFANRDWIALSPGVPTVLFDIDGPGAVERIWSATPTGVLKIYIDGQRVPLIEGEVKDLLSGDDTTIADPFAFVVAHGYNLYFPIPFADGCRVTVRSEQFERFYYQVTYRRYQEGTEVESTGHDVLARADCVRNLVKTKLSNIEPNTDAKERGERLQFELSTSDAEHSTATIKAGPEGGILWELRMNPKQKEPVLLRQTILKIAFDESETVRIPLGDFFASGIALREVNSVPIGVDADGSMLSRWPMPFEKEVKIGIESAQTEQNEVDLEVVRDDYHWTDRSLYFHARWRAPETFPTEPLHDWNLVDIEGDGFYVGNVLNIFNPTPSWWGEGDEKIYIDNEAFPSYFGTGTEDYYGYAWCSNETFDTNYIGQTLSGPRKNFGYTSLYRFHILDAIRFTSALRFELGVQHWYDSVDVTYDASSFWYARPGSTAKKMATDSSLFGIPQLKSEEPEDVSKGPYRCGS